MLALNRKLNSKNEENYLSLGYLEIFVKEEYRGQNIGSQLINDFENKLLKNHKEQSNYFTINSFDPRGFKILKFSLKDIVPISGNINYYTDPFKIRSKIRSKKAA